MVYLTHQFIGQKETILEKSHTLTKFIKKRVEETIRHQFADMIDNDDVLLALTLNQLSLYARYHTWRYLLDTEDMLIHAS